MAFEFLTDDHLERYGRLNADPTAEQLGRYFTLEPPDLEFLQATARDQHLRLGLAVQLCTLRFLGTFLALLRHRQNHYQPFFSLELAWRAARSDQTAGGPPTRLQLPE